MVFFGKKKKNKKTSESSKDRQWNEDFKRKKSTKNNSEQKDLYISETQLNKGKKYKLGTKKGLSCDYLKISRDQVQILKKCKTESASSELIKILGRSNKTKFKQDILNPLIKCGFLELTIPEKPRSPNQKYRLTGFFVKRRI